MKLPSFIINRLRNLAHRASDSRKPDFVIGPNGDDPYVRRWWIIPRNRFFNIYLHQLLHSDEDRALHDHPWINCSILIDGEYIEHTIAAGGVLVRKHYRAGDVKFRSASGAHRIELVGYSCWTLFMTGPVYRTWGFHCPNGWRPWREFVNDRDHGKVGRGCE